jgi:hypothetical protein
MEGSKGACKEIRLPDWEPPPDLPGPRGWGALLMDAPLTSDLDFRSGDGGVLVGLLVVPNYPNAGPRPYSPAKYRIDPATGRIRKATEGEWDRAEPFFVYRDSTLPAGLDMNPEKHLIYKGKEFVRRGAQWPLPSEDAARLSPDGSFLAVNSWDGEMKICPELAPLGCRDRIQGTYYVEIYDAASASLILSLSGQFQGVEPLALFLRSAWASKNFYFLPLDTVKMNRFVFCDVEKAAK